jgi:sugar lactone lactonase YvrE
LGLPTNVYGLAFGGADGRTLFISGSGQYRLYQVRLPVAGEVVSRETRRKKVTTVNGSSVGDSLVPAGR